MPSLPLGASRYFRSAVFSTVPRGQRRDHSLRFDVWSRIRVLDGSLKLVRGQDGQTNVVRAGELVDVEPGMLHHLEPAEAELKFVVHLYRVAPDSTREAVSRWEDEGGSVQN